MPKGDRTRGMASKDRGSQLTHRTLDVLECFVEAPERGVNEIARLTGLSPSTAHRLVGTLQARGYLEQDPHTRRYRLGRSAAVWSEIVRRHMGFHRVLPVLERLSEHTGESVNMGLLDGLEVVVTLRVASRQALRFEQPVGSRLSPHCTSMGKALLAFNPRGEALVDELDLSRITANTITDRERLLDDLAATRRRGYSIDDEESIVGVSCVAAAVLSVDGDAKAAMAIQAPTVRMDETRRGELATLVTSAAVEVAELFPG